MATCTRGACHNRSATYDRDLRYPEETRDEALRARDAIEAEDEAAVWDALVLCKFIRGCFDDFYAEAAELWSAVTGLELDAPALRRVAQRHWDRKRAINARLGWTPDDDVLPARAFEPIGDGPLAGRCVDPAQLTRMKSAYEALRAMPVLVS